MLGSRRIDSPRVDAKLPVSPMIFLWFLILMALAAICAKGHAVSELAFPFILGPDGPELCLIPCDPMPATVIVRIDANAKGTLTKITVLEDNQGAELSLGTDMKKLQVEMKKRYDAMKGKPVKLILEIEGKLHHDSVVKLLDLGIQAGFKDIAPVLPEEVIIR